MAAYDILCSIISDRDQKAIQQFNCGNSSINRFLQRDAYFNSVKRMSQTNLFEFKSNRQRESPLIGFITLSFRSIQFDEDECAYPVLYLEYLAIERKFQHSGIGTSILKNVISRCMTVSELAGIRALILNAVSEYHNFYKEAGFTLFGKNDDPNITKMIIDFRDPKLYAAFMEE